MKENVYLIPGILLGIGMFLDVALFIFVLMDFGFLGWLTFCSILGACYGSWKLYYRWLKKRPSICIQGEKRR